MVGKRLQPRTATREDALRLGPRPPALHGSRLFIVNDNDEILWWRRREDWPPNPAVERKQ
jgi:hypothetical protein